MKSRRITLAVLLFAALALSACASATTAAPTATLTALANSDTPLPSSTPLPSETPRPMDTITPSPSPSATPTLTSTPSPTSAFAGFRIQSAEYRYGGLSLYFVIPGVTQPYQLKVDGQPYVCQVQASLPDRMYCNGPYYPVGQSVTLDFYALQGSDPVFEVAYVVSPTMTETPDLSALSIPGCTRRGINPKGETEHRIADNGSCTVSTCVDSCGYWYSVDTCFYLTPFTAPKNLTQTAAAKP